MGVMKRATRSENKTCTETVMPNCLKNWPGTDGQKANRQKYRNDSQADRDDRQADFVRRFQRCLIRRFAHLDMTDDIFDLNDGVINENAHAEGNCE